MTTEYTKMVTGLGVVVVNAQGQILLSERLVGLGAEEYGIPGGRVELGETLEATAARELEEECGAAFKVANLRFQVASTWLENPPVHFVQFGFVADWQSGEPIQGEPHKAGPWGWYSMDNLPAKIFKPSRSVIEAYRRGVIYWGELRDWKG